jgi:hypothetical protein
MKQLGVSDDGTAIDALKSHYFCRYHDNIRCPTAIIRLGLTSSFLENNTFHCPEFSARGWKDC